MSLERSPCGADVAAAKCPPDVRKERQAGRNGGRAGAAGDPSPLSHALTTAHSREQLSNGLCF